MGATSAAQREPFETAARRQPGRGRGISLVPCKPALRRRPPRASTTSWWAQLNDEPPEIFTQVAEAEAKRLIDSPGARLVHPPSIDTFQERKFKAPPLDRRVDPLPGDVLDPSLGGEE